MPEVVYEIEDEPSEVVDSVIQDVERGKRMLLKRGDVKKAKRSFRRSRKNNVKVLSAVHKRHQLPPSEVKHFIGRDIEDVNSDLMKIVKRMHLAVVEQDKRGDATISQDTLMIIEEIVTDLENFRDMLRGIEEGEAEIHTNE